MQTGKYQQGKKRKGKKGQERSRRHAQVMGWVRALLVGKRSKARLYKALAISKKGEENIHNVWSQGHNRKSNYLSQHPDFKMTKDNS